MNKKRKNPIILITISGAVLITLIILSYIGLNLEIERLKRENLKLEEILSAERNKNVELKVQKQKLQSEELIISTAESRLGLNKFQEPFTIIEVDQNKIEQIKGIINSRYE